MAFIGKEARMQAFVYRRVIVPYKARCCSRHLSRGLFTEESLGELHFNASNRTTAFSPQDVVKLLDDLRSHCIESETLANEFNHGRTL